MCIRVSLRASVSSAIEFVLTAEETEERGGGWQLVCIRVSLRTAVSSAVEFTLIAEETEEREGGC